MVPKKRPGGIVWDELNKRGIFGIQDLRVAFKLTDATVDDLRRRGLPVLKIGQYELVHVDDLITWLRGDNQPQARGRSDDEIQTGEGNASDGEKMA